MVLDTKLLLLQPATHIHTKCELCWQSVYVDFTHQTNSDCINQPPIYAIIYSCGEPSDALGLGADVSGLLGGPLVLEEG